jgi:hypothetical protein
MPQTLLRLYNVTYLLEALRAEPEETAIARQWICACDYERAFGGGVFCVVCPKAMWLEPPAS